MKLIRQSLSSCSLSHLDGHAFSKARGVTAPGQPVKQVCSGRLFRASAIAAGLGRKQWCLANVPSAGKAEMHPALRSTRYKSMDWLTGSCVSSVCLEGFLRPRAVIGAVHGGMTQQGRDLRSPMNVSTARVPATL